jgi:hypothetical protein
MAVRNACEKLAARLEPYRQKYPDAPFAEVSNSINMKY